MAKNKKPVDPNDDSVETGRIGDSSPRPVSPASVLPFTVDPVDPAHELDFSPVNSKIVVTEDGAYLATPDGITKQHPDSIEARLPLGTKIHKLAEDQYRGQLPPEYEGAVAVYDNTNDVLKFLRNVVIGDDN